MKQNLTDTQERGAKIDDLQDSSRILAERSYDFRSSAKRVKRKMCISDLKWWFVLAAVVALIILVVVVCKFPVQKPERRNMLMESSQLSWKLRRSTISGESRPRSCINRRFLPLRQTTSCAKCTIGREFFSFGVCEWSLGCCVTMGRSTAVMLGSQECGVDC